MKSPFVSELEPNRVITTSFLVHSKEIRQKKSGELYLSLLLADRTGELDAKMWDNVSDALDAFERDDFIKVKGLIQIFHNRPQLTIHKVRRMDDSEIEYADYFPSSKRDPDDMWRELNALVASFSNLHLKSLLEAILGDSDIAQRYRRAPAAKQIHHAFLGELIEHVLSLAALAKLVAPHYPHTDRDLLLTGVILHDIGKIYELNYERGFSYSNDGQLLGHIAIAMRMVANKLHHFPDFPPRLRSLVEHMILSHHGHLEFGSPKVPQFPEALLLHYLDDLDSKMECMRALIQNDRQLEGCFTSYSPSLERTALKMDRYWADEKNNGAAAEAPAGQEPSSVGERENFAKPRSAEAPEPGYTALLPEAAVRENPEPVFSMPRLPFAEPEDRTAEPAAPPPPKPSVPGNTNHAHRQPDSLFANKLREALEPANHREN